MTLLLLVCNIAAITIVARSVNAQEPSPGMLLDLLEKPSANRTLVTTIVECLEDPTGRKTTPAFLKCINGYLHVHNRTKFDSIGFILGNYLVKSAMKLVLSDEKDFYDRTKVSNWDIMLKMLRFSGTASPCFFETFSGSKSSASRAKSALT